jgi:hypothetical protein
VTIVPRQRPTKNSATKRTNDSLSSTILGGRAGWILSAAQGTRAGQRCSFSLFFCWRLVFFFVFWRRATRLGGIVVPADSTAQWFRQTMSFQYHKYGTDTWMKQLPDTILNFWELSDVGCAFRTPTGTYAHFICNVQIFPPPLFYRGMRRSLRNQDPLLYGRTENHPHLPFGVPQFRSYDTFGGKRNDRKKQSLSSVVKRGLFRTTSRQLTDLYADGQSKEVGDDRKEGRHHTGQ